MNKLYIAVYNWWETYSCWLQACSDDREYLQEIVNKWIKNEKECGNSHEAFINEIEVNKNVIISAKEAFLNDIEPILWFDTDIEMIDNGYAMEVDQIIKVNKMIARHVGEIPQNVYSAPFIQRK